MFVALVLNLLLFWFVTVFISQHHQLSIVEFVLWLVAALMAGYAASLWLVGFQGSPWLFTLIRLSVTSMLLAGVLRWRAQVRKLRKIALIIGIWFVGSSMISAAAELWTADVHRRAMHKVERMEPVPDSLR